MSYVTIQEKYKMIHIQIPKVFFTNEKYIKLSSDAKIAYALLLDRHNLSLKNDWIEEETGRIYFIFSQAEICNLLNCGTEKWQKVKKALVNADLLEIKRMGLKQANRMYIKWPEVSEEDIYQIRHSEENPENPWGITEVRKSNFKKYGNRISRSTKIEFQEVRKSNTNNTEFNNTELSNTELNNQNQTIGDDLNDRFKNINLPKNLYSWFGKRLHELKDDSFDVFELEQFYNTSQLIKKSATKEDIDFINDFEFTNIAKTVFKEVNRPINNTQGLLQSWCLNYLSFKRESLLNSVDIGTNQKDDLDFINNPLFERIVKKSEEAPY